MAYQTDARAKRDESCNGIWFGWDNGGTALAASSEATVKSVTGKAGKMKSARLFSKGPDIELEITLDGQNVGITKGKPSALYTSYGCCGDFGGFRLVRYDTVNDKYILELVQELEFGDSMLVKVKNGGGSAVRCIADVIYEVNT